MSALGQKRTFAVQKRMSALPQKADIQRLDQVVAFRVLRQPSKANAPRPVANIGSVVGSGVITGVSETSSKSQAVPSPCFPPIPENVKSKKEFSGTSELSMKSVFTTYIAGA